LARVLAIAGVFLAVVLVAVLMFRSGSSYQLTAYFENAGRLVKGNQVKVGGRTIGKITDVTLTSDAQAKVTMHLDSDFAPVHQGTTATIRASSLSGIANRYVSLQPGPNNAPKIADGGQLPLSKTTSVVDVDQIFNTLDPKTRLGLQNIIRGSADQYRGKAKQANQSLKYFAPAISTTAQLTGELARDQNELRAFVRDTSGVVTTIAQRRDDLASLVRNAGQFTGAIGDENQALARALDLLAPTLRQGSTTFRGLRSTLDALDPLVAASKPATKQLPQFFQALRPLVRDSTPTVHDLSTLVRAKGANNDLVELTQKLPKLSDEASTAFPHSISALKQSQPVLEYIRPYTPDFTGWLQKFAEVAANYDANGHYARIQPVFASFGYSTDSSGTPTLTALPPSERLNGYEFGHQRRCPGMATQNSDGSAPFLDMGQLASSCDPANHLPGP
jgi:phospholipid/cholesterol/gamma-HCH transport system substrate-binding protein